MLRAHFFVYSKEELILQELHSFAELRLSVNAKDEVTQRMKKFIILEQARKNPEGLEPCGTMHACIAVLVSTPCSCLLFSTPCSCLLFSMMTCLAIILTLTLLTC